MFYFHWKALAVSENSVFFFDETSPSLCGWFRDYLWFNCPAILNGYNSIRSNDLSCLSWLFLLSHLGWATGFMFLISWRGYWQELVDIYLFIHLSTPFVASIFNSEIVTFMAVSIVQARLIGLVHFLSGFISTYGAFVLGASL
jgi:photosystem I P700 chlorophyll a apoprotein A2